MKANDLFIEHGVIYRVLSITDSQALVINCLEKKMPYWRNLELLDKPQTISEQQLLNNTNICFPNYDDIPQDHIVPQRQRKDQISEAF